LLGLLFSSEDGGLMLLWNMGWLSQNYTVLHARRQNSSGPPLWEPQIQYIYTHIYTLFCLTVIDALFLFQIPMTIYSILRWVCAFLRLLICFCMYMCVYWKAITSYCTFINC
jgi:hypothetical protein